MIGFGLDLAGFSNPRGTVLAAIQAEQNKAKVILLGDSPFSRRLGDDGFEQRLKRETATLKSLLKIGPIAVDVPIDLQGLPRKHVAEPWELTKRPVDDKFNGLPPLASWLGACVARFAAILPDDLRKQELGARIFETYPAASLQQKFGKNDADVKQYKPSDKKKLKVAAGARLQLCQRLKIKCNGSPLNHDELDALICALAAVATPDHLLAENEFHLRGKATLPIGFRILNRTNQFVEIKVSRKPFDEWIIRDHNHK